MTFDANRHLKNDDLETETAAAFSVEIPQGWAKSVSKPQGDSAVSANELTSLSALIAYVAHHSGDNEFRVERRVADRFNIPNVKCLPTLQFDDAIRYLVDGLPDNG